MASPERQFVRHDCRGSDGQVHGCFVKIQLLFHEAALAIQAFAPCRHMRHTISTRCLRFTQATGAVFVFAAVAKAVVEHLTEFLGIGAWRAARASAPDMAEDEARLALERLDPLWEELFPAEQARIIHLLVDRVDIGPGGADVRLKLEGLGSLTRDLAAPAELARAAA